jgi:hypothetical protein
MATLPLTVTAVTQRAGGLYDVEVALFDGRRVHYLVPATLATLEAVTVSALAMGMLNDLTTTATSGHHSKHRRFTPRT